MVEQNILLATGAVWGMAITRRDAALAIASAALTGSGNDRFAHGAPGKTLFGSMVNVGNLVRDQTYRAAILRHCEIIVPEGGLKWDGLRPSATTFGFGEADDFVAFGTRHGLAMRGTTFAWENAMPAWTAGIQKANQAVDALSTHILTVAARYAGRIGSWDVVNEPLPEDPRSPSDRRASLWQRLIGDRHITLALETAAAAAPGAELIINEYDLEFNGPRFSLKRRAMLDLITKVRSTGAPLHAIGLQAHLRGERDLDRPGLQRFLREVHDLGLGVLVTELDVQDYALPAAIDVRDTAVAARADELLDTVFSVVRPRAVLTWGLTDRWAWVPPYFKRPDGLANRPVPLDEDYQPKPFMRVLDRYRKR